MSTRWKALVAGVACVVGSWLFGFTVGTATTDDGEQSESTEQVEPADQYGDNQDGQTDQAVAPDPSPEPAPEDDGTWAERIENLANIPIQEQYRLALEACEANNGGRVHFDGHVLDCMPDGQGGFTLEDLSR